MSKKTILLAVFAVLSAFSASAQSGRHTWAMGPLTWNDFHHNTAINEKTSYLEYFLDISHRSVEVGNVKYSLPMVEAYTSFEYSWADSNYRTPQLLAYNQCLFDLVEYHRRKLEREISSSNLWDYDELMKKGVRRLDDDLIRAEIEMKQGSDSSAIVAWQAKMRESFDTFKPFTPTTFEDGRFGLGASLGFGVKGIVGGLSNYFTTGGGFDFNFDLISRRHYFTWGTYIGWAGCKQNIWDKEFFDKLGVVPPAEGRYHYPNSDDFEEPLIYKGELATCLNTYWAYGYTVFNNNVHKITPFVGIGVEGFYTSDDETSYGRAAFSWHLGLDYNWQYSNSVDHGSISFDQRYNCTHDVLAINCKLYATYEKYRTMLGMPSGLSLNLQVNLGLWTGNARYE